ncbi:hypothetical protein ACX27_14745 [Nostoc piscinale CENA21]|uniref:Uncharacterized protein n=1 Tax=Nostoc piscinale CENA21 TaxID=224013 RepID=A0A0M4T2R5_9NOSO|nr:hypothetical protein [Nostoc piscinale]ALF53820.1 hypothetical protein ACX27_14745 [Nostoc piscinale CENA21]
MQYAKAREAYNPPLREDGAATRRQPKVAVKYAVLSPLAEADAAFTIQASQKGLNFFGDLAALGLAESDTDPSAPRGFKPATIHAMIADSSPAVIRAQGSNRPYVRYGAGTRGGGTQYNFTAPITADTPTNLKTKVTSIIAAKKGSVGGGYGRIWFEPEDYPYAASGV